MPSWFAQNLQRRLLLYFLQKVSLFSNIDVTTLDVSLGSSSQFTFHDLDLDVDNISVPDVAIRSGFIEKLELSLTVSGGVRVEGSGVVFVVKPLLASTDHTKSSTFSLSKTVNDLASSVLQSGENENMPEEDFSGEDNSSESESRSYDSFAPPAPSVLQAMRNKALDLALSNLTIQLKDITIQFLFSQNNVLEVSLQEALVLSVNKSREVQLLNLRLFHWKQTKCCDEEVDSKEELTMSDSLVYSKAEATSIYMSALQSFQEHENESIFVPQKSEVLSFNTLSMKFRGFASIDDLSISDMAFDFDESIINFPLLFELNDSISSPLLAMLFSKFHVNTSDTTKCQPQHLQNYKRFQNEQNIHDEPFFSSLEGSSAIIKLSDQLQVTLKSLRVKMIENNTLSSTLGSIDVSHQGLHVFSHTPMDTPFFTLIFIISARKLNLTLHQNISIALDLNSLTDILRFVKSLEKCMATWQQVVPRKSKARSTETKSYSVGIECKPCHLELGLGEDSININISAFSVPDIFERVTLEFVEISLKKNVQETPLATIKNINLVMPGNPARFNSYNHGFEEIVISSKCCVNIESVRAEIPFIELESLSLKVQMLLKNVLASSDVRRSDCGPRKNYNRQLKRSVRILGSSSIISKQSSTVQFVIRIGTVDLCLKNILGHDFGDLRGQLSDIFAYVGTDQRFTAHSNQFSIHQVNFPQNEPMVGAMLFRSDKAPVFMVHKKLTGKICFTLRSVCLWYDAQILDFFKNKRASDNSTSQHLPKQAAEVKQDVKVFEFKLLDCSISLKPYRLKSTVVLILKKASIEFFPTDFKTKGTLKACYILLIDDVSNAVDYSSSNYSSLLSYYTERGFANVGKLDKLNFSLAKRRNTMEIQVGLSSVSLSLCADSAQTLIQTIIDLGVPLTFPEDQKYRTKPAPINVLEDVEDDFFTETKIQLNPISAKEDPISIFDNFFDKPPEIVDSDSNSPTGESRFSESSDHHFMETEENYFSFKGCWEEPKTPEGPCVELLITLAIDDVSLKLYDGFDWKYTRTSISEIISQMESVLRQQNLNQDSELIKASIFDSIYLFADKSTDVDSLRQHINRDLQSESSVSVKGSSKKTRLRPSRDYKVRIDISGITTTFTKYVVDEPTEFTSDLSADTLHDVSLSVRDFEVVDNVPSSTWNKLLTILKDKPRAKGSAMLYLNIQTVRPIDFLAATELIMYVHVLPLQVHIDQDTLEFLTRFAEFKDSRFELIDEYPDFVYIQRLEVEAVQIRMDYKPKKVDYSGLKSGHTSEFMNFFILEGSRFQLQHLIVYGVNGFPELNKTLNNAWLPDITGNQLKGILGGVAPMKTLVTLGSGVKALVSTPVKEYKRDRKFGRGLQKGTQVFVKVTTGEFVRLGVKLASGTQVLLENAEEFMGGEGSRARSHNFNGFEFDLVPEETVKQYEKLMGGTNPSHKGHITEAIVVEPPSNDKEVPRVFSLYADQPNTLQKGLKEAQNSFGNNIQLAYEALKKAQGEIKESESTQERASTMARVVPIALLRPIIGATEALSKALQGISNEIDVEQATYLQDKYKSRRSKETL
ncbi:LAQU0S08e00254g1_1 [Lachancea quebecensis]|uniref:Autophagy-related protein 2 n=1 Tax=Lachancea quebecensis TaxID=1654605 RepID=A0A0P1KT16_9SACH|nr:LAQU0S08e00254g1_1 [Lachancea quebecensis]